MANKVFNVDQLRINNRLLSGDSLGKIYYDGTELAKGSSAVPLERTITVGPGLSFDLGASEVPRYDQDVDLSADRTLKLMVDGSTIGVDGSTPALLRVEDDGITFAKLHSNVAGAGLAGGGSSALEVEAGSGIYVESTSAGKVNIQKSGIQNSMLSGQITDDKLNTITTAGKVQGGAVTYDNSTIATGSSAQLIVKQYGINVDQLNANVAGPGLAGGGGFQLAINPVSGLSVNADQVGIAAGGVTNAHLAGSIADSKLLPIETTDKVYGSAIKLYDGTLNSTSNGLHVASNSISGTQLSTNAAGAGLAGGNGAALSVNGGSGITVSSDNVNIAVTGIVNTMIANGTITEGKLAGSIGADKLAVTYRSGVKIDGNAVDIDLASSNPGLEIVGNKLQVDSTIVKTSSSFTDTLSGNYTFDNEVTFNTGIVVKGDLEIRGNTTITQSNEVEIGDNIIRLNAGYAGGAAPDAGLEIERGGSLDHAWLLYDDDSTNKWVAGTSSDGSADLYRIETQEYNRSYSVEVASGVNTHALSFGHTFESLPNVVVSLQHTGKYSISNPDLMGAMVTGLYTTGCHVCFTANTPTSGYYLNVHASIS